MRATSVFFDSLVIYFMNHWSDIVVDLSKWLVYLPAVPQALIAPDFKTSKMPAFNDMLVFAAFFSILGLAQCQKLTSKFKFQNTYWSLQRIFSA